MVGEISSFPPVKRRTTLCRHGASAAAAAHKLARIIFHMLKTREPYNESLFAEAEVKHRKRRENRLRAMAQALGYTLAPVQPL